MQIILRSVVATMLFMTGLNAEAYEKSVVVYLRGATSLTPVAGVQATLMSNGLRITGETNSSGVYHFGDLPGGTYSLSLFKNGIIDHAQTFDVVNSDLAYFFFEDAVTPSTDGLTKYTTEYECERAYQGWECVATIVNGVVYYQKDHVVSMPVATATPAPMVSHAAQFISQTVPTTMYTGQLYSIQITYKNTGTATWTAGTRFMLGAQNPQDNALWISTARVTLGSTESIAPGATKTFKFSVKAPTTSATYNFQWRMLQEGVKWFGDWSPNVAVKVTPPPVYYTVNFSLVGSGSVSGTGVACGPMFPTPGTCSLTMPQGTVTAYSASPASGWKFVSWSTSCTGGSVTFNANKTCVVTFGSLTAPNPAPTPSPTPAPLKVTSFKPNVILPALVNTAITWTATTSGGKAPISYQFRILFNGVWTSTVYSTANYFKMTPTVAGTYQVQVRVKSYGSAATYDAYLNSASFTIASGPPKVTISIVGSGSVSGSGYACGVQFPPPGTCSSTQPLNTVVTLNNTPAAGWKLSSWGTGCPSGIITFDKTKTCTVTFSQLPIYSNDVCTPYRGYVDMTQCQYYHSSVGCYFSDVTGTGLMCWKPQWF
jgi:hypothetical protein